MLSLSISIFHASLGENARLAREAGDEAGNAYWSGLVAEVDATIWQATWAGFGEDGARRARVRDQGHLRGDDAAVLLRRESITADLRERAAQFEQRYGRAPSQRELAQLAQASNFTTRKAKDGALDLAQLHQGWADKLARTLGVPLASVPRRCGTQPRGRGAQTRGAWFRASSR